MPSTVIGVICRFLLSAKSDFYNVLLCASAEPPAWPTASAHMCIRPLYFDDAILIGYFQSVSGLGVSHGSSWYSGRLNEPHYERSVSVCALGAKAAPQVALICFKPTTPGLFCSL